MDAARSSDAGSTPTIGAAPRADGAAHGGFGASLVGFALLAARDVGLDAADEQSGLLQLAVEGANLIGVAEVDSADFHAVRGGLAGDGGVARRSLAGGGDGDEAGRGDGHLQSAHLELPMFGGGLVSVTA